MAIYVAAGKDINALVRALSAPTPESTSTLFPIANLYDAQPWKPFIFGSAAGSSYIDADLNVGPPNGNFETAFSGGLPTSVWVKIGTPTLTRDTVVFADGAASMRMTAGSNGEGVAVDVTVRAGAGWVFSGKVRSDAGGTSTVIRVQNRITGKYLNSGGTWQSAVTSIGGTAAPVFSLVEVATTIEDYATCKQDEVTIRISCEVGSAPTGDVYFDTVTCWPRIDTAVICGHNIPPACAPVEVCSGSTASPTTVRGTFTVDQPTMFAKFTLDSQRYWRWRVTNDPPTDALWMGELILTQTESLTRRQNFGMDVELMDPQDRKRSDVGLQQAYIRTERGRRRARMDFRLNDATDYAQAKAIMERSRNGAHPVLCIFESSDPASAIYGRPAETWGLNRVTNTMRDHSWDLEELPFPIVIA